MTDQAPACDLSGVRLVHVTTAGQALGFLSGQVGYMKALGIEVQAVSSPGDAALRFEASESVPVHTIAMPRRITPVRDLVALAQMYSHFRRVRPQIVHAHTPKAGLLGTAAAWLAGVPVRIYHIRGLPFMTARGRRRALLRWTEKASCTLAHRVLCVSASVREVAVGEGICAPGKIVVLGNGSGNGVDATGRFDPQRWTGDRARTRAAWGIAADALVLGFVGRIVRDKGIAELVCAWQVLRDEFPRLHMLLVGPFEPQDPLPDAVTASLRADSRVHLTGAQASTGMFYAAMDVVVLPTYREGFPNVPLEAAAMGLPVVATRIPGCVDAIEDGVTGALVPPRDPGALTQAIRTYLVNADLRKRHGCAGRARAVRDYRQEVVWDGLRCEYARLFERASQTMGAVSRRSFVPTATGSAAAFTNRDDR